MSPRVWWSGLISTAGATRRTSVAPLPPASTSRFSASTDSGDPKAGGDDRDQAAVGHLHAHSFSSGGIASSASPYSSGSCGSSGWAMPSGKRCSSPCSAMSSRSFSASSKPSDSPSPPSISGCSAGSSVSGGDVAADPGGFLGGLRLFLLDEILVALVRRCGHETAPVSEVCSVELLVATLGGAGACATGSGEASSPPPERPISQPTRPPIRAPTASRVIERKRLVREFRRGRRGRCASRSS